MSYKQLLSRRWGAMGVTAALLLGLLTLNAVAIRGIVEARREAREMAQHELELRLEERAHAFRARLANLRTDLVALAESPPLQRLPERLTSTDPLVQRWARLDVQGSLALFAQSHPALRELWLWTEAATDPVRVGRRDGVLLILDPKDRTPPAGERIAAMQASLPSSRETVIRGWIDLAEVVGEMEGVALEGLTLEGTAPAESGFPGIVAAVEVQDPRWNPPIQVWLVARQLESQVERSVETLAGRYRRTVIWNLIVIIAVSATVAMTLLQMRRRAHAEAEAENERRVRELERSLLHSERLASVGRFAAGVAHEVNNPLEGAGNYLSLLKSDLEAGEVDRARQRLALVREGLDRAAAVVRRVLTFSDPAHAPREILPIVEPIREAIEFLQPRFLRVVMEIVEDDEQAVVLANRVALSQLFLNLLLNACEAQEEGGRVDVSVSEYDSTVVVKVRDRGPGLDAEALDHMFEPFFSTRGSSGLGLAVCHGIVQDHAGEIRADNTPAGDGAVFEVQLPLASSPQGKTA